ncbi:uncharacterized protein CTHT_0021550 [Thermochaetoides thermophila DSM 1495]|uniref:Peptidase A1 domain-containing protein n=1 Tax=Chaetomium thermophilum (strain DSM 1495 / CBS 144.50 / IMI 039719) TaxID=759272 RepID=G0S3K2_CHATD|nr:hypothetical protein CTHT_0021550 [Thermochaetoides thermophila DSM 1495]EGS20329.1 hypothetical protein CTHT_0021550 [Thermochaetoides thermophila DSM 1495]
MADWVAQVAGAQYNDTIELFTIPCDSGKDNKARFSFQLEGPEGPWIHAEVLDLIVAASDVRTLYTDIGHGWVVFTEELAGNNICLLGVQKPNSYQSFQSIGSSLLRRTYLVFDNVNEEVAMAPVKFPTDSKPPKPNIVYFKKYGSKIPSSALYCEISKPLCEYDGYNFSNTGHKVGIAAGVVGGVLVLAGFAAGIWWHRRKTKKGQETEKWKVGRGPSVVGRES